MADVVPNRALYPLAKIKWAKCHFDDLANKIVAWTTEKPYRFVAEHDSERGEHVVKFFFTKRPDFFWSCQVGDIIHSLRTCLDLLACQLVEANGGTISKNTAFPIFDSAQKFKTGYVGKVQGASEAAIDLIGSLEPYPSGKGDMLWRLHEFDIVDKHQGLAIVCAHIPEHEGTRNFHWLDAPDASVSEKFLLREVFPLENGVEVVRAPVFGKVEDVKVEFDCPIRVAFSKPKIVERKPVLDTLFQFGPYVEAVLAEFYKFL